MSFNRAQFLIEVLGADAARALAKAASRSEYLAQMIVPRTILAMLEAMPAYAGTVPGLDGYELTYAKNEKGFSGSVGLYKFEDASIFHVAGALSTAMDLDSLMFNSGRNTELQRLGKSIDLMAKAHWVGETLEKGLGTALLKPIAHTMNAIDNKITPQGRQQAGRAQMASHYQRLNEHIGNAHPVDLKPHPNGQQGQWLAYPADSEDPPIGSADKVKHPGPMAFHASVATVARGGGKAHFKGPKVEDLSHGKNILYHTDNLDHAARNEDLHAQFKASGGKGVRAYVGKFHTFVPKDNTQHEAEAESGLVKRPSVYPKKETGFEQLPMTLSEDPMAKAEKKKGTCEVCGGKGGKHEPRLIAGLVLDCRNDPKKLKKEELEKKALGEGAGKSAGPVAPAAPAAPTATAPQHTTPQKLPKAGASAALPKPPKPVTSSTVKLTRSEQTRACPLCSLRQFNADGRFVGCLCFRALAKSVDVIDQPEYTELHFGEDWDRDTVMTFLESVGRK